MEEEKYFMFYEKSFDSYVRTVPIYNPFYNMSCSMYFILSDFLKYRKNLSVSLEKKIINAKIGTKIKIQKLGSGSDLMIMRIDKNQKDTLDDIMNMHKEINILENNISELKKIIEEKNESLNIREL